MRTFSVDLKFIVAQSDAIRPCDDVTETLDVSRIPIRPQLSVAIHHDERTHGRIHCFHFNMLPQHGIHLLGEPGMGPGTLYSPKKESGPSGLK